jgi:hypothetical protein
MKKKQIVARVSIGVDARELEVFNQAMAMRYHIEITSRTRNHFLGLALFEYCSAVVRLGKEYEMDLLSCDLRRETPDELADRIGEPRQQQLDLPDNIVPLFPAA